MTAVRSTELGARITEARRSARFSQKMLARRLGISVWAVDQLEQGRVDVSPYLAAISGATGFGMESIEIAARGTTITREKAATHIPLPTRAAEAIRTASARQLVLGSIAALVLIRFFTEVVPVVPRAANFIDIPIFVTLAMAAMVRPSLDASARRNYLSIAAPVLLFLALTAVSVTANVTRTDAAPVLVFIYGFLAPLAVYAAVYRLWPPGHALAVSRLVVGLALLQLAVVFTIDLARFTPGHDPDQISGTFGTNPYQLVFFLLISTGVLAGIATVEPRRLAARAAPFIFLLVLATIFLAQYRALLVTTGVSILVIGGLIGARARGAVTVAIVAGCFGVTFSYVASHFPNLKFASTISTLEHSPTFYASERLHAAESIITLYSDTPRYILTGTGPGTFSSRAWQTFASAKSKSRSNVQGAYVSALTGGQAYHTDVSDKYVLPRLNSPAIQGSRALTSPYSSYLSLMAEVGLLGFLLVTGVYVAGTAHALRMARRALHHPVRNALPGLLIGCAVGFATLLQMAILENWLEVTRVTFISWILLAIAGKELGAQEQAREESAA
jgi:transcriptional regulator with XRE-family HTH domain